MKKGKKRKKRKRGAASRAGLRNKEQVQRRLQRLKDLREQNLHHYQSILEKYTLSLEEKDYLELEWVIALQLIVDYEDATPEALRNLDIETYTSIHISDLVIDRDITENFYRASFDLGNALGLALITIDKNENINGEMIIY